MTCFFFKSYGKCSEFVAADIYSEDALTQMLLITDYHELGSLNAYMKVERERERERDRERERERERDVAAALVHPQGGGASAGVQHDLWTGPPAHGCQGHWRQEEGPDCTQVSGQKQPRKFAYSAPCEGLL